MSRISLWVLRGGLALVTLVVVGFLVQAIVSLSDDDDGGDDTIADLLATTSTTAPGATSDTEAGSADAGSTAGDDADGDNEASESAGADAELQAFVDEAIAFIEDARGRGFLERPVVELVDVDTMTQIVLDDIEADLADDPESAASGLAFSRAIGFFGPDDGYLDVYDVFVSAGVLGVYFPASDKLLVRFDGELTLMTKATVVHELVHAFDDQHFDLNRAELAAEGDAGWTFGAAVEGSASYVENLWRDTLSADEAAALNAEELAVEVGDIFSLDFGFLIYQTSVYEAGETWLGRRIEREGISAIDDAVVNGAPSSEVVLESLDSNALEMVTVEPPVVDGEVLWQGTGGQALIASLTFVSDQDGSVSSGWGGDAMTVYLDADGDECLRWHIASDTAADQAELVGGLEPWAADTSATITAVGDLVRVDRCAG